MHHAQACGAETEGMDVILDLHWSDAGVLSGCVSDGRKTYVEGERWRAWYCTPQIPLSWLTLGMWALLSPLHYPCVPASGTKDSDVANRQHQLSLAMKKAARAAGGDFLIITGTFSQQVTRIGRYSSSTSTFDAVGAVGFAVKRVP